MDFEKGMVISMETAKKIGKNIQKKVMSLLEAKAHGMPTVMFDMPHLELGSEAKGTIGVGMMDCSAAAEEIVKLLQDLSRNRSCFSWFAILASSSLGRANHRAH